MKKIFLLIASCFAFTAPLAAAHCQGVYVTGFGGANFKAKQHDLNWSPGYTVSGAVGYKYAPFRVELEGAYRHNSVKNVYHLHGIRAEKNTTALMVNGYYDIDMLQLPLNMTPYVGVGVGAAFNQGKAKDKINGGHVKGRETDFAWQGIVGVAVPVTERIDLVTE
jgi:opacity protein-like surface antigen